MRALDDGERARAGVRAHEALDVVLADEVVVLGVEEERGHVHDRRGRDGRELVDREARDAAHALVEHAEHHLRDEPRRREARDEPLAREVARERREVAVPAAGGGTKARGGGGGGGA